MGVRIYLAELKYSLRGENKINIKKVFIYEELSLISVNVLIFVNQSQNKKNISLHNITYTEHLI